jgi:hypothetical protein
MFCAIVGRAVLVIEISSVATDTAARMEMSAGARTRCGGPSFGGSVMAEVVTGPVRAPLGDTGRTMPAAGSSSTRPHLRRPRTAREQGDSQGQSGARAVPSRSRPRQPYTEPSTTTSTRFVPARSNAALSSGARSVPAAGVWRALHRALLERLRGADRLDWSRASLDSASVRAKGGGRGDRVQSDGPWQGGHEAAPGRRWRGHAAQPDDQRGQPARQPHDGTHTRRGAVCPWAAWAPAQAPCRQGV